jgi:hypothetical protein
MNRLITACIVLLVATQSAGAHAFAPPPHTDPEAIRLVQALDFALLQAVNEHKACVTAASKLADDLATIKAALASKDIPTLRVAAGGVTLRVSWIMGLEERANKSWAAVGTIEDRLRTINSELAAIAFSGRATQPELARAMEFARLDLELIQDPDHHELYVYGETRLLQQAAVMQELADLRPAVHALLAANARAESPPQR